MPAARGNSEVPPSASSSPCEAGELPSTSTPLGQSWQQAWIEQCVPGPQGSQMSKGSSCPWSLSGTVPVCTSHCGVPQGLVGCFLGKGSSQPEETAQKEGQGNRKKMPSLISPCPYMLTEDPEAEEYEL